MSCAHVNVDAAVINPRCGDCGARLITHVLLPNGVPIKLHDYPPDHDFARDGLLPAAVREQLEGV